MPIIPGGFGQAAVVFHAQTPLPNGAVFTWGFENTTAMSAVACATTIAADLTSSGFHSLWCDDVSPVAVEVKLGPNDTGPTASVPYTEPGGQTGTVGAAATSILVSKLTAFGGPRNRGRMYIPGQSESAVESGGVVQSITLLDAGLRCEAFRSTIADHDLPMVILHSSGSTVNPVVTELVPQALVGNQRRRQRR